jgi:hypothetical protein
MSKFLLHIFEQNPVGYLCSLNLTAVRGKGNQRSLVPLHLLGSLFFPIILFLSTTLLTGDDRHLLAHEMASDFTVTRQIFYILRTTPRVKPLCI